MFEDIQLVKRVTLAFLCPAIRVCVWRLCDEREDLSGQLKEASGNFQERQKSQDQLNFTPFCFHHLEKINENSYIQQTEKIILNELFCSRGCDATGARKDHSIQHPASG